MSDPEVIYESYGNKLIGAGASSSDSGGHTIQNSTGTDMAPRSNLQFVGAEVTDNPTNDRTVVTIHGSSGGVGTAQVNLFALRFAATLNAGFKLNEGSYVSIRFLLSDYPGNNRANIMGLSDNPVPVKVNGTIISDEPTIDPVTGESDRDEHLIKAGETGIFVYDGTYLNLVSKTKDIEIIIPPTITDYASYKNAGGNRGENITKYWKDGSLADRIDGVNGFKPFDDLYLWDYIDLDSNITAPSSGGGTVTGTKRIHIGEFNGLNNYQLNKRTDSTNFFNHLRMVTGTHFGMSRMNDTNTTEGGYLGSKMHTDIIGDISTSGTLVKQLYDQLGSLLVPTTELLTNSINASGYNRFGANSGCSNNWTWADVYARLLSEIESNGSIVWSSSGYDTGNAQHQLPAFKNNKEAAYPQGIYYWLKDIATSTYFCSSVGYRGNADCSNASHVYFVRLLLTLGRKPS